MGKDIRYVLATRGEAGIDSMAPDQAGPLRTAEQVSAAAAVGVSVVEFLDHSDGLVINGIELRRDLAAAIRRHRPEVIIGSNYRDRWGDSGPWNHVDHRELGRALPDAVRDAANRWLFTDAGEPWSGVSWIAYASSPAPTHGVDVTDHLAAGCGLVALSPRLHREPRRPGLQSRCVPAQRLPTGRRDAGHAVRSRLRADPNVTTRYRQHQRKEGRFDQRSARETGRDPPVDARPLAQALGRARTTRRGDHRQQSQTRSGTRIESSRQAAGDAGRSRGLTT